MRKEVERPVVRILPWAALALSFVMFLGTAVIQLNAWAIAGRVDRMEANIEILLKAQQQNTTNIASLTTIVNKLLDKSLR